MSKATKRKHVTKEILDNYELPTDNQEIVRIIGSRGNNLHEVETSTGERYLASMPTKFRKNIWVKRGCFVVVEPIEEGKKVKAEIVQMLLKDQIKYVKSEGKWPEAFNDSQSDASDSDQDSDDLPPNPNRPDISFESDSSNDSETEESTSDDDDDEDDDEEEEESGESATNQTGSKNSDALNNRKDTIKQS